MPKGVMLSHRNIRVGAMSVIEYLGLGPDDRLLSVLPYSFDAGLNQLTTMLMTGGAVVHQPIAMAAEVVRMAREQAVTGIAGVPPLWHKIVQFLIDAPTELPALRRITNTGGKIAPNILERMEDVFPRVDICLMYGLTEAFRSTYLPPSRFHRKMGSIGQQIPNASVFVVKHGKGVAGPGEQGELVHAGPLVSLGYWERPELSAQKIRPCPELAAIIGDEPVVYSGDLVRVDEDGDLWFVGRMDEMIKTLGFRLSPTEVEDLVAKSGLVSDVVAFGVEDNEVGQAVHVAACLLPDAAEAEVMKHCRRAMAHYMVPRRLYSWPGEMPRTSSGKLDRAAVIVACKRSAEADLNELPKVNA
jgi:acyl-CoA synthetase (AMP-forming)/AMP-acid ligase II